MPRASDRALLMAERLNQGCTQRRIAAEFNLTPARVSQIIARAAIRLHGGQDAWSNIFHRSTRECAIFIEEAARDPQK
jgi:hypothetical protein